MSKNTILIVDDEVDLLDLLEYNLCKEGYEVLKSDNGTKGLQLAKKYHPELIILDIMMPNMDGHQVCRLLKNDLSLKNIPIIFLTARGDEDTEIRSLEQGADDFIVKPVSISKLMSRVKVTLRRYHESEQTPPNIHIHDIEIDRKRYIVTKNGKDLHLPKKEFEVLYFLAKNADNVLSRKKLLNEIWGSNIYIIDRTVDVHIRKIREKLGEHYIETVKGVGYRFRK